ncbi:metalloproteinase inhibitor 1 [Microcaecilia unicolor]|uniref:Metalloproteinase inhibitor 1 n=1 Tax=Microcaecilia unicolor TaxID=1415580 RepID=A0A6P7XHK9_9AMPH|nr:metalloproteinase inhibitor 1 [Microcaecilia unicolor]
MDTFTYGFLAAALLLLASSGPSEACSCFPAHPQTAYCNGGVVIKARFVGATKVNLNNRTSEELGWIQYEIKVGKIFKGFDLITDLQFLYTPSEESLCGYTHLSTNKSEEFVIIGNMIDGKVRISSCGFIRPWDELSASQKRGIMQIYKNGCNCTIVPCLSMPCSINGDTECLWTDRLISRSWKAYQTQHNACLPQSSGTCTWQSMKLRAASTTLKSSAVL